MKEIDGQVKKGQSMLYQALIKENEAIALVEQELESWQES